MGSLLEAGLTGAMASQVLWPNPTPHEGSPSQTGLPPGCETVGSSSPTPRTPRTRALTQPFLSSWAGCVVSGFIEGKDISV